MATNPQTSRERKNRDRTFAVLHALLQLGPGRHQFRVIAERSGLSGTEVRRRLLQLIDAKLCNQTGHGYYELSSTTTEISRSPNLVSPGTRPLLDVARLLEELRRRTGQVVLLHTYSPVTAERVCIAAAGAHGIRFRRALALTPCAVDQLRQAPLDSDAPGLAMLANLAGQDTPLREDLRRIRSAQLATTRSPLPRWSLVSVPLKRLPGAPAIPGAEPRVVAAISILAPEQSHGAHVVAYGQLLCNAVRAAVETTVVIARPDFASAKAA
ncbi:hypothetical protein [Streptomyces sp. NPDC056304]|uniref:hypothetical protein n=1 Tax=Streptomyces sp. NPDC056304 TaxID=3345778 RepID=UPI0035D9D349